MGASCPQDTNDSQYACVRLLAGPEAAAAGRQLLIVGDSDQSIYSWRGADVGIMRQRMLSDYPGAVTYSLQTNYRSSQAIVSLADGLLGDEPTRSDLRMGAAASPDGRRIELHAAPTCYEEGSFVADRVARLRQSGVPYASMAVLYRQHAVSSQVENALRLRRVPHRVLSGNSFYDRAEASAPPAGGPSLETRA